MLLFRVLSRAARVVTTGICTVWDLWYHAARSFVTVMLRA
jgi:hypothetical protein